jgi:hypothetical protein
MSNDYQSLMSTLNSLAVQSVSVTARLAGLVDSESLLVYFTQGKYPDGTLVPSDQRERDLRLLEAVHRDLNHWTGSLGFSLMCFNEQRDDDLPLLNAMT